MLYIILFLLVINFIFENKKDYYLIFLLITLVSVLRYGIGIDYFAYKYLYYFNDNTLKQVIFNPTIEVEVGFRVLMYLFRNKFSYEIFIAFFALISSLFIYKIIKKDSCNSNFSLFIYYSLFFLTYTMSGIRQGFTLFAGTYLFLNQDNKRKLYAYILLLSLIHKSVLIIIIFDKLSDFKLTKKSYLILVLISFIFSMSGLSNYFPSFMKNYYYYNNISFFDLPVLFKRLYRFCIFLIIYRNHNTFKTNKFKKLRNYFYWSVIFYYFLAFYEVTAARLMVYGQMSLLALLPQVLKEKQGADKLKFKFVILSLLCLLFMKDSLASWNTITRGSIENKLMPYVNLYNKDKYNDTFYLNDYNYLIEFKYYN